MSEISLPYFDSDLLANIRPPRHGVLVVCLVMAGIFHLALLSQLRIDGSPASEQRTLQVRILQPPVEQPAPRVESVPLRAVAERVAAIETEEPEVLLDNPAELDSEPLPGADRVSGFQLYRQALGAANRMPETQEDVAPRSFGTGDFPSREVASDPYARSAPIRQFVTRARKVVEHDRQGNVMVRRVDEFGNVTCMQRRGFAGDGNPPLWYPIIGDACFIPGGNN